jgi:hypothetical protein
MIVVVIVICLKKWASLAFVMLFFNGFLQISCMSFSSSKVFSRLYMNKDDDKLTTSFIQ